MRKVDIMFVAVVILALFTIISANVGSGNGSLIFGTCLGVTTYLFGYEVGKDEK